MYTVIPWQIIKRSHAEASDDRSLPLLGQQLLPDTFLGSQWLLHLMGVEEAIHQHTGMTFSYQVNPREKNPL